ncbi:hypothetical protein DXA19_06890 [Firmicutes bacterium AM59-13]|nr:hypothetical protein DXA19_06890 [Firmicutes bacterium AM59-13]
MAEQVFAMVNAERVANGIPALIWSEDVYNIAVQRCYENDIHAGMRAGTSENQSEVSKLLKKSIRDGMTVLDTMTIT